MLQRAHEGITTRHHGIRKTTKRILDEFYWPRVHADVKQLVKSCYICQRTAPKGRGRPRLRKDDLEDERGRKDDVDSEADMGKKTTPFPVNVLKKYQARQQASSCVAAVSAVEGYIDWEEKPFLPLQKKQIVCSLNRRLTEKPRRSTATGIQRPAAPGFICKPNVSPARKPLCNSRPGMLSACVGHPKGHLTLRKGIHQANRPPAHAVTSESLAPGQLSAQTEPLFASVLAHSSLHQGMRKRRVIYKKPRERSSNFMGTCMPNRQVWY